MNLLGRKSTDAGRAEELFSPYLDGQVTPEESKFLERYLAEHVEAREKFDLLKSAVQMTKALPALKAPRSFVLPRSMARKSSLALRLYPVMRFATVAAVALFAFALAGDFTRQSAPASPPQANMVLNAQTAETLEQPQIEEFRLESATDVEGTTEPSAAALAPEPAPTEAALATPAAGESAPSIEAESDATADALQQDAALSVTEAPTLELQEVEGAAIEQQATEENAGPSASEAPMIDALRLAVIGFGVLVVVLGATTWVLRRQI